MLELVPAALYNADGPSVLANGPQVFFLTSGPNGGRFTQNRVLGVPGHFYKADGPPLIKVVLSRVVTKFLTLRRTVRPWWTDGPLNP